MRRSKRFRNLLCLGRGGRARGFAESSPLGLGIGASISDSVGTLWEPFEQDTFGRTGMSEEVSVLDIFGCSGEVSVFDTVGEAPE